MKALVFLADGFEEVEAITPIDYLRRAGIEVVTVAVGGGRTVTGSHGIPVTADSIINAVPPTGDWNCVVLPGGTAGVAKLAASPKLNSLLKQAAGSGVLIAAICAAPAAVLAPKGLLAGKRVTGYPGTESTVTGAQWTEGAVVIDGKILTSRGAGTAAAFSLAIIEQLLDNEAAQRVASAALVSL
jgi:4-methyl-5(b-hydroxyethyl)-thiazole monophosphate biosynthesis